MPASPPSPRFLSALASVALSASLLAATGCCRTTSTPGQGQGSAPSPCDAEMVAIDARVCVDAYEATVVEVDDSGAETPHAAHLPVTGMKVRAVSRAGVPPQGYISQVEARAACVEAGKRLCTDDEWKVACGGANEEPYPYGTTLEEGACNDKAQVSPVNHFFGTAAGPANYTWEKMNDPRLNQLPGGLAKTGAFPRCRGKLPIFDMVGNLHEWTETPSMFRGGYYLDTQLHGPGCRYQTSAHMPEYHDYSTGFRCCKDARR